MEQTRAFQVMIVISAVLMVILVGNSVEGQVSTPCTSSMISSFTPCANMITGSTNNNGAVPSSTCCESLRYLANSSLNCACLLISAGVPFQLPFTSTLAVSLTKACNINALPSQCKAAGTPLPAPGPPALGRNVPGLGPIAASPLSPQGSEDMGEANKVSRFMNRRLAERQVEAPAPTPVQREAPTTTPTIRPLFTPHASSSTSNPPFLSFSPFMFLFLSLSLLPTLY